MMTMTMQLGCQGWVKILLLPWLGTVVAAQEKWLQFLGALQLLDEAHMSVQPRKRNTETQRRIRTLLLVSVSLLTRTGSLQKSYFSHYIQLQKGISI